MFFSDSDFTVFGIIAIPFVLIIGVTTLVALIYLIFLIVESIRYKSKLGLQGLKNMFLEETTSIPDYEPAIMGYLVNCQKIGRREICSTLFDLIGKKVISISMNKGFVSDDNNEYILELAADDLTALKSYEACLVRYLFGKSKKINSNTLNKKLYKNNLREDFFIQFLQLIQLDAKQRDFFSGKTAKKNIRVYKVINKVVTIIASVMSILGGLITSVDDFDSEGYILAIIIFALITAGVLWLLKFLISFMFNMTCYYNDFSKNGSEDYRKWSGFKKYLKNCSTLPDHPLMGVLVWERYYAYAIGLKCSKKFFKQMKKIKVVDSSIDIAIFESLNDLVKCIGTSAKKLKNISLDSYGGSHVDY